MTLSTALSLSVSPSEPLHFSLQCSFSFLSLVFSYSFLHFRTLICSLLSFCLLSLRGLSLLQRNSATYSHPALHTCKALPLCCQLLSFFNTRAAYCFQLLLSGLLPLPPSSWFSFCSSFLALQCVSPKFTVFQSHLFQHESSICLVWWTLQPIDLHWHHYPLLKSKK